MTVTKVPDGYVLTAKDLATGAARWSTTPWWPFDSVRNELPRPEIVTAGGKDYVALSISGNPGDGTLTKGTPTIRIAVYPTDAAGSTAAPLRTIDIPAQEPVALPSAQGALLAYFGDHQAVTAVDVTTGKITSYSTDDVGKPPDAEACRLCGHGNASAGVTSSGPLVRGGGNDFWVPGAWYSPSNVPQGAEAPGGYGEMSQTLTVIDDRIIAGWPAMGKDGRDSDARVWAVHDMSTGKVKASTTCAAGSPRGSKPEDVRPVFSADHRYLVYGILAFDLATGQGRCKGDTATDKGVVFTSVDKDGTAYGHTDGGDASAPVALAIDSGTVTVQPPGTEIPTMILENEAVYLSEDDNRYSVAVCPRR
ncbi:hypothetical protein [Streptomyces sp. G-G2]|uniref:hypothetical protein n=1 Tax=Streptomyces sp. G-G2 TaxID=3046201 RepID=UPI0024BBD56C|nr:hypothetical protein [Streptomyces sp. G-G2]MDJ0384536.1 hypothetical protein [Streptomyces sp. G-G2]